MKKFIAMTMLLLAATIADSKPRSPEWMKVRNQFVYDHPICEICGSRKDREVHHIRIFYRHPELELDKDNLITLCKSKNWGLQCHKEIGHGGNYRHENPWIKEDAVKLREIGLRTKCYKEGCMNNDEFRNAVAEIKSKVKEYNYKTYGRYNKRRR